MLRFLRAMHSFLGRLRYMSQRGNDQKRKIYTSYCSKTAFFLSLSLHISTQVQEEGVFFQAVEREMDVSFFFFFDISLLVLHRIDVLLMTSKASDSVPVNIRHIKRPKLRNSDGLWVS